MNRQENLIQILLKAEKPLTTQELAAAGRFDLILKK